MLQIDGVTYRKCHTRHVWSATLGKKHICHTTPGRDNVLLVGWGMGSDLGKGFIVLLLSCDLHMMQPLLIGQIVPPQGYLHF